MSYEDIVIYALGNPGKKYSNTRHNAGWIILDESHTLKTEKEYSYKKIKHKNCNIHLIKSVDFMNTSGYNLRKYLDFFKVDNPLIILAHDDSDMVSGSTKLSEGGRSGGHNGVQSVYDHCLGSTEHPIYRLKIGIRPEGNKLRSETFVLKDLSSEELKSLKTLSEAFFSNKNLDNITNSRFDLVQNDFN